MGRENSSLSRGMEDQKQEADERVPGSSSLSRSMKREIDEESPEAIQKRANRDLANQNRVAELRRELGILTDIGPESTAAGIDRGFEALAGSVNEATRAKIKEYDERIRAAIAGKPLKEGDTAENVKESFKGFARKEWNEDFKP